MDTLKVIAFKLFHRQVDILSKMINHGLYPSLSEAIRMASFDFSKSLFAFHENENETKLQAVVSGLRYMLERGCEKTGNPRDAKKVSTSCKFPIQLLTTIDDQVRQGFADNRSDFLRLAIMQFLSEDGAFFGQFIDM